MGRETRIITYIDMKYSWKKKLKTGAKKLPKNQKSSSEESILMSKQIQEHGRNI